MKTCAWWNIKNFPPNLESRPVVLRPADPNYLIMVVNQEGIWAGLQAHQKLIRAQGDLVLRHAAVVPGEAAPAADPHKFPDSISRNPNFAGQSTTSVSSGRIVVLPISEPAGRITTHRPRADSAPPGSRQVVLSTRPPATKRKTFASATTVGSSRKASYTNRRRTIPITPPTDPNLAFPVNNSSRSCGRTRSH